MAWVLSQDHKHITFRSKSKHKILADDVKDGDPIVGKPAIVTEGGRSAHQMPIEI